MRHTSGPYYDWPAPGLPFSIQISLEAIDRIEADISSRGALGRGLEVGGVLYGRLGPAAAALYIDGYLPVPCGHRRGPSWRLSGTDHARLDRALRKGPVAGFYRSHLRPGLYLDQHDYALIETSFTNPHDVFLLVRPRAGEVPAGGFFFWEEDSIRRHSTYLEFPFRASELRAPDAAAGPPAPPVHRMGAGRLATAAAALALMGAWGGEYHVVPHSGRPAASTQADSAPTLRVQRNGSYLEVGWDPSALAVAAAPYAVLHITDGTIHKELHLDPAQLRAASVAYSPWGNEVTFELQLAGSGIAVTETFRLQDGPHQPTPAVRAEAGGPKVLDHRQSQSSGGGL
jgi:hypothetical protein